MNSRALTVALLSGGATTPGAAYVFTNRPKKLLLL